MPLLVPVIRITDIRAPFASREAAKRLLGGAVGGEEALDPELVQRDVVGCSEAAEDREEAQANVATAHLDREERRRRGVEVERPPTLVRLHARQYTRTPSARQLPPR